jgi:hypothetical protein
MDAVIRIAITQAAFEAMAATLPFERDRLMWIERFWRLSWSG